MYINFQQTRVSRSVQTVHTNTFANNRKVHKFATTNSNLKKYYLWYGNILFDIVHNIIENILPKHKNM